MSDPNLDLATIEHSDMPEERVKARERIERKIAALEADLAAARRENATLREALEAERARVCECGGEDKGEGPGVGAIDSERSSFDYGADAHDGAGNVITDYFDCPCVPLRAALAAEEPQP